MKESTCGSFHKRRAKLLSRQLLAGFDAANLWFQPAEEEWRGRAGVGDTEHSQERYNVLQIYEVVLSVTRGKYGASMHQRTYPFVPIELKILRGVVWRNQHCPPLFEESPGSSVPVESSCTTCTRLPHTTSP